MRENATRIVYHGRNVEVPEPEIRLNGFAKDFGYGFYNHPLCETIDNYNASAYYEPSYWLAEAYRNGNL